MLLSFIILFSDFHSQLSGIQITIYTKAILELLLAWYMLLEMANASFIITMSICGNAVFDKILSLPRNFSMLHHNLEKCAIDAAAAKCFCLRDIPVAEIDEIPISVVKFRRISSSLSSVEKMCK